jgi:hypothetical protein
LPKLASASTPSVCAVLSSAKRREAVPMPPLKPKALMPVPAPTAPSATGPAAASSAAKAWACVSARSADVGEIAVIAFEHDRIDRAGLRPMSGLAASARVTNASKPVPTLSVLPAAGRLDLAEFGELHQPGALAEAVDDIDRGAELAANRLPSCGSRAVKPVRRSPFVQVQWPSLTPGTSVIA